MAGHELLVKFWGVRGSYPVPGEKTLRYGGNTACVEIRTAEHLVVLDAGTGIVGLGQELMADQRKRESENSIVTLLISHTHHDHIQGLLFFRPLFKSTSTLYVYGPRTFSEELQDTLSRMLQPQYSPVPLEEMNAQKVIRSLSNSDSVWFPSDAQAPEVRSSDQPFFPGKGDLVVRTMRSYAHPKDGVYVFRIEYNGRSVVYATDTEGYSGGDTRLIRFARGADLLIHDAQYDDEEYQDENAPRQGFGHSTIGMATTVAEKAEVKQLALFHHDPSHDDDKIAAMEATAKSYFENTVAAYEGLELRF
jgi:phosphoribosyl 1,2-cyclic phosphodiesterase